MHNNTLYRLYSELGFEICIPYLMSALLMLQVFISKRLWCECLAFKTLGKTISLQVITWGFNGTATNCLLWTSMAVNQFRHGVILILAAVNASLMYLFDIIPVCKSIRHSNQWRLANNLLCPAPNLMTIYFLTKQVVKLLLANRIAMLRYPPFSLVDGFFLINRGV